MFTSYPVIKQLEENENGYRDVLKEVLMSESNLIVLDCEQKILGDVLMQAQQVGTISQGYFYLLTSLDAHVVNLDNYKYGGTNFTAFRLIDVDKPEVQNVIYGIVESIMDSDLRSGHVVVPEGIRLAKGASKIRDSRSVSKLRHTRPLQYGLGCGGDSEAVTWIPVSVSVDTPRHVTGAS